MSTASPVQADKQYAEFLAQGKFMLLRDRRSGEYMFFPRVAAPLSGSLDLEWVPAGGGGVVYSTSVMRERNSADDYNVALIDLDEGPRMMSRVDGVVPHAVRIGMRVRASVITADGASLVVFRPE
jgi:uncharacterized OB-fold protein